MSKPNKKRNYIDVNVPRAWEPYFKELLEKPEVQKELELNGFSKTNSGLGIWIIRRFLVDSTSFHLQHFNTYGDRITIVDNKIRRMVDVHVRPVGEREFELWCEHCDSTDCEHVKYALDLPEAMKPLEKKGWKYRA